MSEVRFRWTSWVTLFLGAWLVFNAFVSGHESLSLGRSDLFCGFLVGALSVSQLLKPKRWKEWGVCFAGVWLVLAPIVFWAPTANAYNTDTLIGILLIVLGVALPHGRDTQSEFPPGWSYNPSTWANRIPIVVLGFTGFFVARSMATFQLGLTPTIWEPIFGEGTKTVLTSEVATLFPISDAGLGAAVYLLESLSGVIGDTKRWRTMPWMVFLFFVLVVPAGIVSIVLIMLQPIVVGAWCTLCLITAFLTLLTIPPAVDEIFASAQLLLQVHREGKSVWKTFWGGDHKERGTTPSGASSSSWNLTPPWTLVLSSFVGVWIIVSPLVFGVLGLPANSNFISGTLVVTFAVTSFAEPVRALRFLNILFGLWICLVPFIFGGIADLFLWSQLLAGGLIIGLNVPRGKVREQYGSWSRYII